MVAYQMKRFLCFHDPFSDISEIMLLIFLPFIESQGKAKIKTHHVLDWTQVKWDAGPGT